MTTQEAIKLLRNSGSGETLLNVLDKVVSQLQVEAKEPTLNQIEF